MAKREQRKLAITALEEVSTPAPDTDVEADPGPPEVPMGQMVADAYGFDTRGELCRIVDGKFVLRAAGILNLARRSGAIGHCEARVIRDKDLFALDYGKYVISHAPDVNDGGQIIGAYAIVVLNDGFRILEHRRANDIIIKVDPDSPISIACGTAEELLKREIMIVAFKSVPFDLTYLWAGLEAERQSINGEPVTALPPRKK